MRKQTIVIALLLLLAVFGLPAAADYRFDGYELTTRGSGTVSGGVYTGVGDNNNEGFAENWNYTTNYTLPNDITVDWAEVYIDAWGCTENNAGWINLSFNQEPWQKVFYNATNDNNLSCWGSGHGVIIVHLDQTNNVKSGTNRVDVRSSVCNGRIIRATLVCAYNNDTEGAGYAINYCANAGNRNLHYNYTSSGVAVDNTTTWFNGTVDPDKHQKKRFSNAKLTTVFHASGGGLNGGSPEPDYAYFNVIPKLLNHSPYYHRPNQLGDDGDEYYGDDDFADGQQFTLRTDEVTDLTNAPDNSVTYWRGCDVDNSGDIYHNSTWTNSTGAEGEAYLHPCIAVLTVNTTKTYATKGFVGSAVNIFGLPLTESEPVSTALTSIGSVYFNVYRYNSTGELWETYRKFGAKDFTDIDPARGYSVSPTNDCTLRWIAQD